ncbi:50S ribosomal protein L32 [Listeria booriae]|uniref:50S ribosomal protein L32 n=1 Tax=Listeria booriae TaxID=1552123 RepID=UPI0016239628|nr:50S ribosomal protein L32 [Listeria booriae]MBC2171708.1 50S ribosomal protein L32 [Listeria booriae]MBC2194664.1 50S ribosomal protein L32 [Listeria booriae]
MAVPFRRTSKAKKRKRRTHFKLQVPGMVECPNCGEYKLSHRVCPECGQYNGKEVVESN